MARMGKNIVLLHPDTGMTTGSAPVVECQADPDAPNNHAVQGHECDAQKGYRDPECPECPERQASHEEIAG